MPNYDDVERVFDLIDTARAREAAQTQMPIPFLADDEKQEAYRWADGNELKNIVDTPGFDIIMHKLETYMDDGIKTLMVSTVPTDKEAVLANFALAHAAHEIFTRLKNDISNDLEAAKTMPDVIKQGIRLTRGTPVDAASLTNKS